MLCKRLKRTSWLRVLFMGGREAPCRCPVEDDMDSRTLGLLALAVAIVIGGAVVVSGGTVDDDGSEVKPREDRHLDADDERSAEMVAPGVAHTSRYTEPESHDREDYVPDWRDDAIASLEAELRKEQELRGAAEHRLRLLEAERSRSLVEEFLKTDVARSLTDKQREAVPYFIKGLGRIPDDWIVRKLAEQRQRIDARSDRIEKRTAIDSLPVFSCRIRAKPSSA